MEDLKKKTLKLKPFEIVAYSICAVLVVWGLVEMCLGIAGANVAVTSSFRKACDKFKSLFGLSFLGWGIILLCLGTVLAVIILCIYAKNSDREYEKAQRRMARLGKDPSVETKPDEVIDAKVEETK